MSARILSLVSLSTLAVLICSLQAPEVNALTFEPRHGGVLVHSGRHEDLARRKRDTLTSKKRHSKRCKPKSTAPSSSAAPAPTSDAPAPPPSSSSDSSAPAPTDNNSSNNGGSSGNSNNGGNNNGGSSGSSNNGGGGGTIVGGTSKAGAGWGNGDQDLSKWQGLSTIYTWSPSCPDNVGSFGMTCCPMLWGWNQLDQFNQVVNANTPSCVMGMNEPEIGGQSNMDAGSGAQLWNQAIRPLKSKGVTLISPATTSDPAGKQWMLDFFNACGGNNQCDVDIVACHWYDVSGDALISYLTDLHNTYNKPLWLTEFACQNFNGGAQCSEGDVWSFQSKVTAWMEQTDYILKYMPFGAMHDMQGVNTDNQLMNGDGTPNALAKAYFGLS